MKPIMWHRHKTAGCCLLSYVDETKWNEIDLSHSSLLTCFQAAYMQICMILSFVSLYTRLYVFTDTRGFHYRVNEDDAI